MTLDQCPNCAQPVVEADRYCERCGQDLSGAEAMPPTPTGAAASQATVGGATTAGATASGAAGTAAGPATVVRQVRWLSSAGAPSSCGGCGGTTFVAEGYCEGCGQRRPAARDHTELDLGPLAAVTDKGKRHRHNEDAVALGQTADTLVAVVCDGVSSSSRPDTASHGAVDAAAAALLDCLVRREPAADAIRAATRAAQAAAALAGGPDPGNNPPSSTFVCAVVTADEVTIGWVGDSRAYWLPDDPNDNTPNRTTVDGSASNGNALHGTALDGNALHGNALSGTALDGNALSGTALDGNALHGSASSGTALDGGALDGSTLDGSASSGSALEGTVARAADPERTEPEHSRPGCLTVDDSLAGQLAAAGRPVPDDIPHSTAAALVRWLGADAPETTPHLYAFNPPGPGRVLVCSDGLFRYRPDAADLAAATPRADPLATAQALVRLALDAGGQDNITVAVLPYPPEESS